MNATLEKIRRIHQGLMYSLQGIVDFAHPQLLLLFTSLFLCCLTKMFFTQEAIMRLMYRQAIGMGTTSFWIIMVVFAYCYNSQKVKDQACVSSLRLIMFGLKYRTIFSELSNNSKSINMWLIILFQISYTGTILQKAYVCQRYCSEQVSFFCK